MRIKITKCDVSLNWYYNHIGEEFEVIETNDMDGDYLVLNKGDLVNVSFDDCKEINNHE